MEEQAKTMKVVWTIVERGPGKSFWTRVGVGFVNRDGSMTLRLDAIPISGTLQVREWEAYDRRPEDSRFAPAGAGDSRFAPAGAGDTEGPARPRTKPQSASDSLL